jgi:hypothetical protein
MQRKRWLAAVVPARGRACSSPALWLSPTTTAASSTSPEAGQQVAKCGGGVFVGGHGFWWRVVHTSSSSADPSGALKFKQEAADREAGAVTITMKQPSTLPLVIAVFDSAYGVAMDGETVMQGGTSTSAWTSSPASTSSTARGLPQAGRPWRARSPSRSARRGARCSRYRVRPACAECDKFLAVRGSEIVGAGRIGGGRGAHVSREQVTSLLRERLGRNPSEFAELANEIGGRSGTTRDAVDFGECVRPSRSLAP